MTKNKNPLLFCGSSHGDLGAEISSELKVPLGRISLKQFPDGEISAEILENVRGRDAFVLQSVALNPNFFLMELLIVIDALKRASAKNIVAIIPYFGYCRQDRKDKPGEPITAKLVANLLSTSGATRLITLDLHAGQLEGFFEIPVDHLHCQKLLAEEIIKIDGKKFIVVAPDIGSVKVAKKMSRLLQTDLAIIEKQREGSFDVQMTMIGDVKNKNVVIVDDMCSTAGTLSAAGDLCKHLGANRIVAAVTHGICVGKAMEKIDNSALEKLIITNSIPSNGRLNSTKLVTVSVAGLISATMKNLLSDYD